MVVLLFVVVVISSLLLVLVGVVCCCVIVCMYLPMLQCVVVICLGSFLVLVVNYCRLWCFTSFVVVV